MQKRKRKTRCDQRPAGLRGCSPSCKWAARKGHAARFLSIFTLFILSSCSLTKSKKIDNFNIQQTLSKICLSQEGKGRVKDLSNKVFFTYETLNETDKSLYQLVLDIPLYGSEAISVDYSNVEKPVVKLEEDNFKKRKNLKNFMRFIKKFSKFIVLQQAIIKDGPEKYCDDEGAILDCALAKGEEAFSIKKLEDLVRVTARVGKKRSLEFEFFDLKDKHFERVSAKYRNLRLEKSYFEADLFLGSCYDK